MREFDTYSVKNTSDYIIPRTGVQDTDVYTCAAALGKEAKDAAAYYHHLGCFVQYKYSASNVHRNEPNYTNALVYTHTCAYTHCSVCVCTYRHANTYVRM